MSAQEFKDLGNKAFQAGQYHEAIDHYSNAIALDENHVFYSNRSGAYAALSRWAEALEDADSCISTNPSFAKGYARRAAALVGMGHHKDAASAYQEALKIDPQNPTYQDELRACAAAIQQASPQQQQQQQQQQSPFGGMGGMGGMDDMFNPFGPQMIAKLEANPQTKQLLQSRATREALEDISKNPQNLSRHTDNPAVMMCLQSLLGITPEMQMKMAQEEHEREQQQKAREDQFKSRPRYTAPAMERDTTPTQPAPVEEDVEVDEELEKEKRERKEKREQADKIKEQGAVEYKAKKFDEAIALFKQANEIDDSNPTYFMNIAACYFELKNYPQCISSCKDALGASGPVSSSQKAKIYGRMANAHLKSDEFQLAIDCFKRSLLEENSPQVRQQLRAAEQAFKQYQIESYYDDEKSEIAKNEGNNAFKAAEYGKAIDLYTDALKRDPKNYKVYSNRALCYIKVCAWEKALEDCDKCLSFDPKFIKAMIRKGKVLHFLKSYHKAIEIFREAIEIDPNNEELLEAMATTQRAIYSSPSDPAAQEARMAEAMKDPEIQLAMANPRIQKLLDDMQKDPNAAMAAFQNPEVAPLLEKLIAAGIIRLG